MASRRSAPETTLCRKHLFSVSALLVVLVVVYANTFDAGWHFDDFANIHNRDALHLIRLDLEEIERTFYDARGHLYRPVVCLTFALNYLAGGLEVFGYHLVNLSVHVLAAVALYLFLFNLFAHTRLKNAYGPVAFGLALVSALLWAINPIQTQAVTYIVQRMASMAGLFSISCMYFFLKGRLASSPGRRMAHFTAMVLCGLLAFGSKENTAVLPVVLLMLEVLLIRRPRGRDLWKYALVLLLLLLVPLGLAVLMKGGEVLQLQQHVTAYEGGRDYDLGQRLLSQPRAILFYVSLLLYPMPDRLSLIHDFSPSTGLLEPVTTLPAFLILSGAAVLALALARRHPLASFCALFFLMNHAIEGSFLPLELVFEHRNYLPSMLFFVLPALLCLKLWQGFSGRKAMRVFLGAAFIVVLVGLGHGTFVRNMIWKTEESLWLDAAEKSPRVPRVHHNLGRYYADAGRKQEALAEYRIALSLPRGPNTRTRHLTHYNMGLIYESMGDLARARRQFLAVLELAPGYAAAYTRLGALDIREGRLEDARKKFLRALALNPASSQAHNNLGFILLKQGQWQAATQEFREALRREPGNLHAMTNLGVAYKAQGDLGKAVIWFRRVLSRDPGANLVTLHLVETLVRAGTRTQARDLAHDLVARLEPEELEAFLVRLKDAHRFLEVRPDVRLVGPVLLGVIQERAEALQDHAMDLVTAMGTTWQSRP